MPYGTDAFRKVVLEKYWQVATQLGLAPGNILASAGGRDALVKAYQAMLALGYGRIGDVIAHGQRAHSSAASSPSDLTDRLLSAHNDLTMKLGLHLTLKSECGWQSQLRMPFIQVGTPGVYNVTPDYSVLGVELRPIPQDNLVDIQAELLNYCRDHELELKIHVMENGIKCSPSNPYLTALKNTVRTLSGAEPKIGYKLPATSARFAPNGQGVVWGQSGIGPHSKEERHFIPSILPSYRALQGLAEQLELISA